jgi:hypothetical protein
MAKALIIGGLMVVIIALLLYVAVKPAPTVTIPVQQPIQADRGTPTPTAPEPVREPPSPRAEETTPPPGGIQIEAVYPEQVTFWVNEIMVPPITNYEGAGYIPIKKSNIKTFAGSFGPYAADPTAHLKVVMCAEFYSMPAAPSCETVPLIYRDNYVSFARGYQYDEYIGGMAAKDYVAFYDIYTGDTKVGSSNKAVIRTIKD